MCLSHRFKAQQIPDTAEGQTLHNDVLWEVQKKHLGRSSHWHLEFSKRQSRRKLNFSLRNDLNLSPYSSSMDEEEIGIGCGLVVQERAQK